RTGACYPALRYLPGRDFHPLVQSNFQDATPGQRTDNTGKTETCCSFAGHDTATGVGTSLPGALRSDTGV
ncbi:MAG: hypothetical protein ACRDU0_16855, partial [Mycobacterium sp.]